MGGLQPYPADPKPDVGHQQAPQTPREQQSRGSSWRGTTGGREVADENSRLHQHADTLGVPLAVLLAAICLHYL